MPHAGSFPRLPMLSKRTLLGATLLAALYAVAPLNAQAQGPRNFATLAMVAEPQTLDPMASTADLVGTIMQHVYETLYTFDAKWNVVPMLAEGMPKISADGKTYAIALRKGVMLHSGRELTADDVVASLQRWMDQSPRGKAVGKEIDSLKAKGPLAVEIVLKEPYAPLLSQLALAVLPAPVLQALRSADIPPSAISVVVQSVEGGPARISHRAKQPMNPASVMKLVTTYAALDTLGPAYSWRTELLATVTPRDGVLDGDLYIRGSGDPALSMEQFWLLLRELRSRGIRDIRGDVITDRSRYALLAHDPGAFDNEPLAPYNVGPDALLLAHNALRIRLQPTEGGALVLWSEPPLDGVQIDNRVQLVAGDCGDWKDTLFAAVQPAGNGALTLQISGRYARDCGERIWNVAPLPHADFFARALRAALELDPRAAGTIPSTKGSL